MSRAERGKSGARRQEGAPWLQLTKISAAIVVVTEGGPHIWAIVNAIADRVGPVSVILESPESKKQLLLGRARRQGWLLAIGQLGTMVLTRLGKRFFAGHAARLIAEQKLGTEPKPGQKIVHVSSANAPDCLQAIVDIRPGRGDARRLPAACPGRRWRKCHARCSTITPASRRNIAA